MSEIDGVAQERPTDSLRRFRIAVASPSDVQEYRDVVERVVHDLNRSDFVPDGLIATTWRWEVDAFPALSLGGPQHAIDRQMLVPECDLVIAILWTRMGTVGTDGLTGTEHEIERALAAWSDRGRPAVSVYFSTQAHYPRSAEDASQFASVLKFKERISSEHLTFDVDDAADFERKLRGHLVQVVRDVTSVAGKTVARVRRMNSVELVRRFCPQPDYFGQALLDDELTRGAGDGVRPFWWTSRNETQWLGNMFAFWTKVPGFDARKVAFSIDPSAADRSAYPELPESFEYPPNTAGRQKVAFKQMVGFTSDESPRLVVAPIDFGLKRYVEVSWRDFFQRAQRCSAFGIESYRPVPSITVVHGIVVTSDGWILVARRSSGRDYFPRSWSASFEEQVDVGDALPGEEGTRGDRTVFDTVARGLAEEFGIHASLLEDPRLLCVGRESILAPTGLVINAAVVAFVRLAITLDDVWSTLEDFAGPIDRSENDAWAGLRASEPAVLADIVSSSASALTLSDATRLPGVELDIFDGSLAEASDGVLQWHPTAPARLGLCAAMLRNPS